MTTREYDYAVWGTQGGGLVREVHGTCIFIENPDHSGLGVGDEMPKEWDTIPANDLAIDADWDARNAAEDFSQGVGDFVNVMLRKLADGSMTAEDARPFEEIMRRDIH